MKQPPLHLGLPSSYSMREPVMSYMVCEASSVSKLREEVDHYLRKGWRAQGGIAVACSPTTSVWWFYQAIVLDSPETKPPPEEELA